MGSEFWHRFILVCIFILVTDVLLFLGLRRVFVKKKKKPHQGKRFALIYLIVSGSFIIYAVLHYLILRNSKPDFTIYRQYMIISGILIAVYLPKATALIFMIVEYIMLLLIQVISFIRQNRRHYDFVKSVRRFKLISWLGIVAGVFMLVYVLYGIFSMRTYFKVVKQDLRFYNLPPAFDNTKIVLISDAHLGSFFGTDDVQKGLEMIEAQHPDLIVFTGDMINVEVRETYAYKQMFNKLRAPLGKFSVLGNHDMGDYMKFFEPKQTATKSTDSLVLAESAMGFSVLRNGHAFLHKGNDSIAVIGIDNWGLPPFRKTGNLFKALAGIDPRTFKVLLSHDPSLWTIEVRGNTDVDLTLSGHTHAVQMGINQAGIKWSPISFKYPKWMGLYQWGTQFLYVNPGFGYLGFPGRIGIRPEITVITLRKS